MSKFLKRTQVAELTGTSERHIENLIESDRLPKPVIVGKTKRWVESEVKEWMESKIAERDARKEVVA